jgi:uncharacterized membrane protein YdjX (TVP38/TMEM64 family)
MDSSAKSGAGPGREAGPPMAGEAPPALPWRKLLGLALGAALLLTIVYLSPLRGYLGRFREVSERIRAYGALAPAALATGVAGLVAIGFPRLLLCVVAGMTLGFWSGLFWAQLGTLAGNYLTFLAVRWGARGWAERYLSRHGKLNLWLKTDGTLGVILARQVPIPGLLVNLACGLFPLRHRHFLLGTLLGQLPEAIPCTLIGAGLLQRSFSRSAWVIGLGVTFAVLLWLGLRWLVRRPRA